MKKFKERKTKGKIICICIIVFSLAIVGVGTYLIINHFTKKGSSLEEALPENELVALEDNKTELMEKYHSLPNGSDYSLSFKAPELVEISFEKMKEHNFVVSHQYGLAHTSLADQTVRSTSIKNGNKYFLETITNSTLLHSARRFYQEGDTVKNYEGKKANTTSAQWSESRCETSSVEDFQEKWGKDLTRPIIHIISTKTATGTITKDGEEYHISLNLDKDLATKRYVKQVLAISPAKNPVFTSIEMQFKLNKNLDLISYHSNENYKVDMILKGVETNTKLTEYYTYDVETPIPDINTNVAYESGNLYGEIF